MNWKESKNLTSCPSNVEIPLFYLVSMWTLPETGKWLLHKIGRFIFGISNWKKPLPWFPATSTNCSCLQTLNLLETIYLLPCTSNIIENNSLNLLVLSPSMVCYWDWSALPQLCHSCSHRLPFDNILQMSVPPNWKQEVSRWALTSCNGNTIFLHLKLIDWMMLSPF